MVDKSKFLQEDAEGYAINVVGRNVYVTEAMKKHAWDKMSKAGHFGLRIMHVQITLDIQKLEHVCTIVAKLEHMQIKVQATSTDMYVSIDKAIHRLQNQIKRWKDKIEDHSNKKISEIDMVVNVVRRPYNEIEEINAEIEKAEHARAAPQIDDKKSIPLKTLSADEALMKIDLSGDQFLIFRDEADRKIKVIYRTSDGHFGVIQPE